MKIILKFNKNEVEQHKRWRRVMGNLIVNYPEVLKEYDNKYLLIFDVANFKKLNERGISIVLFWLDKML